MCRTERFKDDGVNRGSTGAGSKVGFSSLVFEGSNFELRWRGKIVNQHAGTVCVVSLDLDTHVSNVSCLFVYIHSFTSLFIGFYWFVCFIVYRPVNPASAKLREELTLINRSLFHLVRRQRSHLWISGDVVCKIHSDITI